MAYQRGVRINDTPSTIRLRFNALAEHYLKADFGADAVRPKSENTTSITESTVRNYLIDRWGKEIADDIKPLCSTGLFVTNSCTMPTL